MLQDKRVFIDKLNKCIWELQVLRNTIEEARRFDDTRAHKARDALYATRAKLKPLAKELTDIYSQSLVWH